MKAGNAEHNYAKGLALPKVNDSEEMAILTPNEFTVLFSTLPERWQPFALTPAATGAASTR